MTGIELALGSRTLDGRVSSAVNLLKLRRGERFVNSVTGKVNDYIDWYSDKVWPLVSILHRIRTQQIRTVTPHIDMADVVQEIFELNENYGFVTPSDPRHRFDVGESIMTVLGNTSRPIYGDEMGPMHIGLSVVLKQPEYFYPYSFIDTKTVELCAVQDPNNGVIITGGKTDDMVTVSSIYTNNKVILPLGM